MPPVTVSPWIISEYYRQRAGLDKSQGEGGHPHQAESTFHEQRPGLPAATHMVRSFCDHHQLSRLSPTLIIA